MAHVKTKLVLLLSAITLAGLTGCEQAEQTAEANEQKECSILLTYKGI